MWIKHGCGEYVEWSTIDRGGLGSGKRVEVG
jgi:hypothetical protein